jgi:rfaE bifunctional protein kinase chain/domain
VNTRALKRLLPQFAGKTVGVVGDLVADEYLLGQTARISREAPVLILRYVSRELVAGGAGNAAANLAALGARVVPIGVVGDDPTGRDLESFLRGLGCDTGRIVVERDRLTTTKTRILAGGHHTTRQQVIRIDRGEYDAVAPATEARILQALEELLPRCDALVVSDYQYGVISPAVIDWINTKATGRLVTVDSRYRLLQFRGVAAVTPNEEEVEAALDLRLNDDDAKVIDCARRILEQVGCRGVLVTRGSRGMALAESDGTTRLIPIFGGDEIADVTGAGDTVIAVFTLALAAGASMLEAAQLANVGGGLVVMKRGTATVTPDELAGALARIDGA